MRAATEAFRAGARRVRCRGRLDKVASARIEIVRVLIVAEQDGRRSSRSRRWERTSAICLGSPSCTMTVCMPPSGFDSNMCIVRFMSNGMTCSLCCSTAARCFIDVWAVTGAVRSASTAPRTAVALDFTITSTSVARADK